MKFGFGKYELNGISFPFGGVSWNRGKSEKDYFAHLLFYLESKRILVNPICMEIKDQCIESVLEIRRVITDLTADGEISAKGKEYLRALINSCNAYLDAVNDLALPHLIYKDGDRWEDLSFDKAMKDFRYSFRDVIKLIEQQYNITFEGTIPNEY